MVEDDCIPLSYHPERKTKMKVIQSIIFIFLFAVNLIGNTFYLDPVNGNLNNSGSINDPWGSLSEVISSNYIRSKEYANLPYTINSPLIDKNITGMVHAGDTLILREGLHGTVFLRNYINDTPIVIMNYQEEEVYLERVQLQACKNWIFDGVRISSEPYGYYLNNKLFFIESHGWQGPSSHIIVKDCEIFSAEEPWTTAQEWVNNSSDGLYIKGDSCRALSNKIFNVDMGLSCIGDYIIAERNSIENFSGDGGRVLGSNISFNHNLIKNNYNVDDNHDDGIQSFTTNGYIVNDNEIIGNLIINRDDNNQILAGPLQGIACFDGFYNNWLIANNVISVDHWHGISLLGANRCTIIHNTVIDPTPMVTPGGSWIRIDDHKDGTPSSNCLVANNVANKFVVDGMEYNNIIFDTQEEYSENFQDYVNFDFNLIEGSILIDSADPDYSIPFDFELNQRDNSPDMGAYEYIFETSSIFSSSKIKEHKKIYPNPFTDKISIINFSPNDTILFYDIQGKIIISGNLESVNQFLKTLNSGIYNIVLINGTNEITYSTLMYKL